MSKLHKQLNKSTRIVSFGCSVVLGEELKDIPGRSTHETPPSEFSYPALIAKKYTQGNFVCYAKAGDSNDSIVRKIIEYVNTDKQPGDFVVVGMTGSSRMEFFNSAINKYISCVPTSSHWKKHKQPKIRNSFKHLQKAYETLLSYTTEESIENNYHTACCLIKNVLDNHDIPHVVVKSLSADYSNCNNIIHGDQSLMDLTFEHGFSIKEFGHPGEEAHAAFYENIIKWIKNDIKVSDKKEKNILVIAQPRSGGTFVADILSQYHKLHYEHEILNTHRYGYDTEKFSNATEFKKHKLEYYSRNYGYLVKASWYDLSDIEDYLNESEWDIYHVERTDPAQMICSSWLSNQSKVFHVDKNQEHVPLANVTVPMSFVDKFINNSDYGGWYYNLNKNLPILKNISHTKILYNDTTTENDILEQCGLDLNKVSANVTKLYPSKQDVVTNYSEIVEFIKNNYNN